MTAPKNTLRGGQAAKCRVNLPHGAKFRKTSTSPAFGPGPFAGSLGADVPSRLSFPKACASGGPAKGDKEFA